MQNETLSYLPVYRRGNISYGSYGPNTPLALYAVLNPVTGCVKIGVSQNVCQKLSSLMVESGQQLDLIGLVEYGNRYAALRAKRRLLCRYKKYRKTISGKQSLWFAGTIKRDCIQMFSRLKMEASHVSKVILPLAPVQADTHEFYP